jgi:mono/diheme cytochrome c family protein
MMLGLVVAALVWAISTHKLNARLDAKAEALGKPNAVQLADAGRQLRVLGCVGCHGEGLSGRKFLDIPGVATLHASNLTFVARRSSDQQLAQAIRQGVGYDGRPLLVMPSEGYQFLSDTELAALIAAIRAMPKVGQEQPPVQVGPKGHVAVALGEFATAPELVAEYRSKRIADYGPALARGRHLVEVNCTECHGPQLGGKELEPGVVAPDLAIAGAYELEQFQTMLRTGVAPGGKDIGLMGQVARRDFKYLTDDEIDAIHTYLAHRAQRNDDGAPNDRFGSNADAAGVDGKRT